MELTPLRYFREIARVGHMTRAARALGVSQPALSAMLRKLEEEVGAPLLHRTGRGVELTEPGKVFLAHATDALRRADAGVQAVRELVGLQTGSIRVGAGATVASYLLPRVISAVRSRHPGLRFYVRESGSAAVAAALISGELDLGIVTLPVRGVGDKELLTIPLMEDELRLIVPPKHALAGKKSFRWSELAHESVIGFEAGSAVREVVDQAAAKAGVVLDVVMELRSIQSIQQMVAAGVGVGFVSRLALSESDAGAEGLVSKDSSLVRGMAICRRADRVPSPAAAAVERELLDAIKGRRRGTSTR